MTFNQIMALLLTLGLVASHAWVYHLGGQEARLNAEKRIVAEMTATAKIVSEANQRADKAEDALQAKLNEPKVAPKIRTVVRENPSSCSVSDPVHDSVLDAVDKANARISRTLGPR